jgi:hypothetical protein
MIYRFKIIATFLILLFILCVGYSVISNMIERRISPGKMEKIICNRSMLNHLKKVSDTILLADTVDYFIRYKALLYQHSLKTFEDERIEGFEFIENYMNFTNCRSIEREEGIVIYNLRYLNMKGESYFLVWRKDITDEVVFKQLKEYYQGKKISVFKNTENLILGGMK